MTQPQPAGSRTEQAVQYALAQVGKPYVWGTEGPDTFDCSGLVWAAFRHAGFTVSRTTFTQIRDGSSVGRLDMGRGDLWFTDAGHVAIYLGGGQFVEAPNRRSRVRVVPVRAFFAGRRIGPPSGTPDVGRGAKVIPGSGALPTELAGLTDTVNLVTDPHTWVRLLTILVGAVLILVLVRGQIMSQLGRLIGA